MIVRGIVLIILVFGAFLFLGLKISESINLPAIKIFFFSLYFMTLFSIFNLCLTIYFFIKLKDKKGKQGRKGLQGIPGESGQPGHCGENNELLQNKLKAILLKGNLPKDFICKNREILINIFSRGNFTITFKIPAGKGEEVYNGFTSHDMTIEKIDEIEDENFILNFIDLINKTKDSIYSYQLEMKGQEIYTFLYHVDTKKELHDNIAKSYLGERGANQNKTNVYIRDFSKIDDKSTTINFRPGFKIDNKAEVDTNHSINIDGINYRPFLHIQDFTTLNFKIKSR